MDSALFTLGDSFVDHLNEWGKNATPFVFLVDFSGKEARAWQSDEVDASEVRFNLNGITNDGPAQTETPLPPYYFRKTPPPFDEYLPHYNHVVENIRRGNSFLVNLSVPVPIATNLSLADIYQHSRAPYRFWFKDRFVSFSPEIFIRIRGHRISSYPMKGTISTKVPGAAQIILSDLKETAEHATIVDLIRNDLSMVADKVWVERYRYLDRIPALPDPLLQVSSEIAGLLPDNFNGAYGDLLRKLLPAGSVTGAPKPSTVRIIQEAEGYERGYYTGVMGAFDGQVFESAVIIRYIEQQPDGLVFKSGGGITARSRAAAEYQEIIDKVYLPFNHEPAPADLLRDDLCPAQEISQSPLPRSPAEP